MKAIESYEAQKRTQSATLPNRMVMKCHEFVSQSSIKKNRFMLCQLQMSHAFRSSNSSIRFA